MSLSMVIGLFGGLGIFLYGMQLMADGLQKAAGERLRSILELFTSRPAIAVLTGAVVTALIQSSSTTTVMVVGFVNSGLMTLSQAIGTIMGANIGTTITAQIVSFDIYQIMFPSIALGAGLSFFGKKRIQKHIGMSLLGFGLLLLGLSTMSEAVYPLRSYQPFLDTLFLLGRNPVLGILAGAVFTMMVQSSSATTGLVIAFSLQGVMGLSTGLALIVGANLGTCITAVLAALGASLTAKRAALAHVLFNTFGIAIFLIFRSPFTELIRTTSPAVTRQIANAHTIFNITNTVLLFPFIDQFVKLVTRILPGEDVIIERKPKYLDPRMQHSPGALTGALNETTRMADLAIGMVEDAVNAFVKGESKLIEHIDQKEEVVNELEKAITSYLARETQGALSRRQSQLVTNLMHIANDIERVGDHAVNITELAHERIEHGFSVSDQALRDLEDMYQNVVRIFREAVVALQNGESEKARRLIEEDDIVDEMEKRLRHNHIERINEGVCNPESGVLFLDMISNLERVGDHANNIAEAVAGTLYPERYY